jgi:hypothetical protein
VGHAGTLVEINDRCLSIAAELASSGSGGIAGLQRMSATQMLAAFFAVAAVDCEFTNDGLTRNLGLKLLIEAILDDIAAAIRTLLGQRCVERFINLGRRRRFAMTVLAMLFALLAAWLFGIPFRFVFGKRRRLSLGGAFEFFDSFLEFTNGLLQLFYDAISLRELFAKLLIFVEQILIRRRVHADLDSDKPCQLYEIIAVFSFRGKIALNKHKK